jgi:phosphoglycolate phosphatase
MKFCGVIFDLDGTLLDTIEDITTTLNLIMSRNRFRNYSIAECKLLVGDGMEVLVKRAVPEIRHDPEAIKRLIQEYRKEYARAWRKNSRPYPGILEILGQLKQAGIKTAVLSNKSHEFTELMVKELLAFPFDVIRGAMPGVPVKPDPEPAHLVLKQLNLTASEVVFVGDSSVDMETAVAAGIFPAGALWGFRGAQELLDSGARVLLKKPSELLPLILDQPE